MEESISERNAEQLVILGERHIRILYLGDFSFFVNYMCSISVRSLPLNAKNHEREICVSIDLFVIPSGIAQSVHIY